jgi:uncharacterized membrane protein YjgN (DUF898 family)
VSTSLTGPTTRRRVVGLLGIALAVGLGHALALVLTRAMPDLVRTGLATWGSPQASVVAALDRYGWLLYGAVGWPGALLGGVLAALVAPSRRVWHAFAVGLVLALLALPETLAASRPDLAAQLTDIGLRVAALPALATLTGGLVAWPLSRRRPALVETVYVPAPTAEASPEALRPSFHGSGGDLLGIHVVNVFLTLVTLGLYRFWARVRVRKFLYANTELDGDRFAFHGTGREAFNGWSRGMMIVGVPLIAVRALEEFVSLQTALLLEVAVGVAAAFVVPIAITGAWRYRLSRTEWRGLRFSYRGRPAPAIRAVIGSIVLTVLSLGICFPLVQVNLHRVLMGEAYYGQRRFGFDGRGGDLVGRFALAWIGMVAIGTASAVLVAFTYGLSAVLGAVVIARLWYGYAAYKQRYLMAHTAFETARFRSTVTGSGLFVLNAVNALIVALTFGLGVPWAKVRSMRYAIGHLAIVGTLDLAGIRQEAQQAAATGEGVADVLDADAIDIGVGV